MYKDIPVEGLPPDSQTQSQTLGNFIGREIRLMEGGKSEVTFDIGEQFLNFQGVLHGGAYATMLDTACGVAIRGQLDMKKYGGHSTLELKTSYLRAGQPGRYLAKGNVLRLGKSVAFVDAELFNAAGELVSYASATFHLRLRAN